MGRNIGTFFYKVTSKTFSYLYIFFCFYVFGMDEFFSLNILVIVTGTPTFSRRVYYINI